MGLVNGSNFKEVNMPTNERKETVSQESPQTLTDDQIVTERKLARRSFLRTAGVILAGGAVAIVAGRRAAAQDTDPDAKKDTDPDQKKKDTDPDSKKGKKKGKKSTKKGKDTDPDAAKH
jgi:hypothetical protein